MDSTTSTVVGIGLLVLVVLLYMQLSQNETFLSMAASPIGDVANGQTEPTLDMPLVLFEDTQFRGTRKSVHAYEEVPFVLLNADGDYVWAHKSAKLAPGYQLVFRERKSQKTAALPKKVVAKPRMNIVEDFWEYLREDTALKDPQIFGFGTRYPDKQERWYTIEARPL